jgi:hypothetical protein
LFFDVAEHGVCSFSQHDDIVVCIIERTYKQTKPKEQKKKKRTNHNTTKDEKEGKKRKRQKYIQNCSSFVEVAFFLCVVLSFVAGCLFVCFVSTNDKEKKTRQEK